MQTAYNYLDSIPQAMSDSLQLRLRPSGENAAHRGSMGAATGAASSRVASGSRRRAVEDQVMLCVAVGVLDVEMRDGWCSSPRTLAPLVSSLWSCIRLAYA